VNGFESSATTAAGLGQSERSCARRWFSGPGRRRERLCRKRL